MAAKAKPKTATAKKHGGARSGCGRKPKAVEALRQELIAPLLHQPPEPELENVPPISARASTAANLCPKTAAQYALDLFDTTMRDHLKPIDLRLDCSREILNRTIGKPRTASAPAEEAMDRDQVVVYMPHNDRGDATG